MSDWQKPLAELRPHPHTRDDAPVSYRAGQIRTMLSEIERLRIENERLKSLMPPEALEAVKSLLDFGKDF